MVTSAMGKKRIFPMEEATKIARTGAPIAHNSAIATWPGNPHRPMERATLTSKDKPLSLAKEPNPVMADVTRMAGIPAASRTPPQKAWLEPEKFRVAISGIVSFKVFLL